MIQRKKRLTLLLVFGILLIGIIYQAFYDYRKAEFQEKIRGYYWKYYHQKPNEIGVTFWTQWALNRWGLQKVERIAFQEGRAKDQGFV